MDFTFVSNVVKANIIACYAEGVAGEVFNIAGGENHSVLELFEKLKKIIGVCRDIQLIFKQERKGDVKHSVADISKANKLLLYKSEYNFEEGLVRTVKFFLDKDE